MEAIFKLKRSEVEEACVQYLEQRGVLFTKNPHLADLESQTFEFLYFTAEVALGVRAPVVLPAPATARPVPLPDAPAPPPPPPATTFPAVTMDERLPPGTAVIAGVDIAGSPSVAAIVNVATPSASPDPSVPRFRESSLLTPPVGPGAHKASLRSLESVDRPPSPAIKLPEVTRAFRESDE